MAKYYFKLPQLGDLTIEQQSALEEVNQIALSGGPGTGKSVISLWRHINNLRNNKKSLLLTYTTTLKTYFIAACKSEANKFDLNEVAKDALINASEYVSTSLKGRPNVGNDLHEVIVDEAQDLPINYYEGLKDVISNISYGADESQILYPEQSSTPSELKFLFTENAHYVLSENFRSTHRLILFAKNLFPDAYIPKTTIEKSKNNIGELPVLLISEKNKWNNETRRYELSNEKQDKAILELINNYKSEISTYNVAILVPWKKDVEYFVKLFKDNNISDFTYYFQDSYIFPNGAEDIKSIHITTFKSAKGLEFDTVIIPNFYSISKIDANIVINGINDINRHELQDLFNNVLYYNVSFPKNKSSFYLQVSESDINDIKKEVEDINNINLRVDLTWKDVYVAITRAKSNLFLITEQDMPELNEYVDQSKIHESMFTNNSTAQNNDNYLNEVDDLPF